MNALRDTDITLSDEIITDADEGHKEVVISLTQRGPDTTKMLLSRLWGKFVIEANHGPFPLVAESSTPLDGWMEFGRIIDRTTYVARGKKEELRVTFFTESSLTMKVCVTIVVPATLQSFFTINSISENK